MQEENGLKERVKGLVSMKMEEIIIIMTKKMKIDKGKKKREEKMSAVRDVTENAMIEKSGLV
mgnify:CR=1 FL=1